MSKILYPIGTSVVVKANVGHPSANADIGRHATVVGYTKSSENPYTDEVGVTYPYYIQFKDRGDTAHANVDELRKLRKKSKQTDKKPEKPQVNCYTKEEVDVLLAQQWSDLLEVISAVDSVAVAALHNTENIAQVTDRNFHRVEKSFKTLSHDDD